MIPGEHDDGRGAEEHLEHAIADIGKQHGGEVGIARTDGGTTLRTVTCSQETAYELLQWFRAAATTARSDPAQRERALLFESAMNVIRAALDV